MEKLESSGKLDFLERELAIGDYVVFEQPRYRNLTLGKITAFTPKQVRLIYMHQNRQHDFLIYPSDLVKIEGQDLTKFLLKHTLPF